MLSLAEQSKSVECFTHVSTAYVNSDQQGKIAEKIYDLPNGLNPVALVDKIMKMSREEA